MPRFLVAARADQRRRNGLEFLQAGRIAGHRSGFGFSTLRTGVKAIARQRGHCRIPRASTRPFGVRPWLRRRGEEATNVTPAEPGSLPLGSPEGRRHNADTIVSGRSTPGWRIPGFGVSGFPDYPVFL